MPVERSGAGTVLDVVTSGPRLVVSTPGAEPVAPEGYAAALLLDAWALLDRPTLLAGEEALRRWLAAAALVRPASDGGRIVLAGAPTEVSVPAVEALVRWDPTWFAERELTERRELSLPPAARLATLTGPRAALERAVAEVGLPASAAVLGPLPHAGAVGGAGPAGPAPQERWRTIITVPRPDGPDLTRELAAMRARASARKDPDTITVRVDPPDPTT